jgi:hypothetical protein
MACRRGIVSCRRGVGHGRDGIHHRACGLAAVRRVDPGRLDPLGRRGAREQTGGFRPKSDAQRGISHPR